MTFLFPLLICLSSLGAAVPAQQNYIRNGSAELGNAGTGSGLFQMPMWIITSPSTPPYSVGLGGVINGNFGGPLGTPFGTTVFGGLPSPVTLAIQGLVIARGGVVQITNAIRIVVQ